MRNAALTLTVALITFILVIACADNAKVRYQIQSNASAHLRPGSSTGPTFKKTNRRLTGCSKKWPENKHEKNCDDR